jgi:hypothetical protein
MLNKAMDDFVQREIYLEDRLNKIKEQYGTIVPHGLIADYSLRSIKEQKAELAIEISNLSNLTI